MYLFISLILRTTASTSLPIRVTRLRKAIIVLTATATVTRLEIALFLLPVVCSLLFTRRVSIVGAFTSGLIGGLGALGELIQTTTLPGWSITNHCHSHLRSYRSLPLVINPRPSFIPLYIPLSTHLARNLGFTLQSHSREIFQLGCLSMVVLPRRRYTQSLTRFLPISGIGFSVVAWTEIAIVGKSKGKARRRRADRAVWAGYGGVGRCHELCGT